MKPLLVGEINPYSADPKFALYPHPERSAGARLCNLILRLPRAEYLRRFDRVNLCEGKWSLKKAREKAAEIWAWDEDVPRIIVVLGARPANAFYLDWKPYEIQKASPVEPMFIMLPHPSGRNHLWNEPGAYERARQALIEGGVGL